MFGKQLKIKKTGSAIYPCSENSQHILKNVLTPQCLYLNAILNTFNLNTS